jgi:hypothetical protein
MFVTVFYSIAAEIFLLEPRDGGGVGLGGEGAWASFTVYSPLRGILDSVI